MEGTMDPESADKRERSFQAKERLVVVAGNPAGIDVTWNGQEMGRMGPPAPGELLRLLPKEWSNNI